MIANEDSRINADKGKTSPHPQHNVVVQVIRLLLC